MIPTYKPKCPNHGCPLEGIGFPLPAKGEGICPKSGCHFAFEADVDEETVVQDKFGGATKKVGWKFTENGEVRETN